MTRCSPLIGVAAPRCLLAKATSAHAECAWIAWMKTSVPGKPVAWKVMGAPPDEAKCRAFAVALNDLNKC